MEIAMYAVGVLGSLLYLVGWVWMMAIAFNRGHTGWGVVLLLHCCLPLLGTVIALVFYGKYKDEVRTAGLVFVAGVVLSIPSTIYFSLHPPDYQNQPSMFDDESVPGEPEELEEPKSEPAAKQPTGNNPVSRARGVLEKASENTYTGEPEMPGRSEPEKQEPSAAPAPDTAPEPMPVEKETAPESEPIKPAPEPEPTKLEPTQPEPTQPEPTQPEPTQPEPTQPEPTQPEPTKLEPSKPAATSTDAGPLSLKGISGSGERAAAVIHTGVKNYTVMMGDEVSVQTPDGSLKLKVLEIKDGGVKLEISGRPQPVHMSLD